MTTINTIKDGTFLIERCDRCFGLFFDPGELEATLAAEGTRIFQIDYQRLSALAQEFRHDDFPIAYLKCPLCGTLMNRVNFGRSSGVVIDQCKNHGIWLDGGELRHLIEWTKAGGMMLKVDDEKRKQKQEADHKRRHEKEVMPLAYAGAGPYDETMVWKESADLLKLLVKIAGRILF
jgi:Zn-finger nucleic acid-binding protein